MAKKYKDLAAKLDPARRARAEAKAYAELAELNLREIRERLSELSQEELAELLDVTQGYVSKLERHGDMQISKLYELVRALGGEVEIHARFPTQDGKQEEIIINQFEEIPAKLRLRQRHG